MKPKPKQCPKTADCVIGKWVQSEPSGCATKCGVGAGQSGTPGLVTCTTVSCDANTKPKPKQCPKTADCDVNECLQNNGGCDSKRTCMNTVGSMTCGDCSSGYENDGAKGCKDVDECLTNNGGCDSKRTCTNTVGSMTCGDCPSGHINDGAKGCKPAPTTTTVDPCLSNNGGCDSKRTCTNAAGSAKCGDCPSGYENDGAKGCKDVDECLTNNGGCDSKRTCTNAAGSAKCG